MICPNNIIVIVRQARHLIVKAKDGINKAYVTIELLKEKYVSDTEASLLPKWMTECSFSLPEGAFSNTKAAVIVCVYHKRNGLYGLEPDEFLGQIQIPLSTLTCTDDEVRTKWYKLVGRKSANKERGQIELSIQFTFTDQEPTDEQRETNRKRSSFRKIFSGSKKKLNSPRFDRPASAVYNSSGPYDYGGRTSTYLQSPTNSLLSRSDNNDDDVFFSGKTFDKNLLRPNVSTSEMAVPRKEKCKSLIIARQKADDDPSGRHHSSSPRRSSSMLNVKIKSDSTTDLSIESPNEESTSGGYLRNILKMNFFTSNHLKEPPHADNPNKHNDAFSENNNQLDVDNLAKKQLVQMVHEQRKELQEKDTQIKELHDYIDKLLVKVMLLSPQILEDASN